MLKYHSSRILNGLTPRVTGCSGKLREVGVPVRVGREAGLVVAAQPVQDVVALALGVFDGVVQVDEADALVDELLDDLLVVLLEDGVAAAAVHVEDDRRGAVEGLWGSSASRRGP